MSTPRVAIITGATGNLGKAIALRLADDGLDIALNDIPSAADNLELLRKDIEAKGRRAFVFIGDVSEESAVEAMVLNVAANMGQLDVMIANAGIARGIPLLDTPVDYWNKIFSVNARGAFLCYKHAAKQMIKQGKGGRIIGASSVAGQVGEVNIGAYSATKFAVRGLTQTAALEWGRHGITVNAYCPGAIESDMLGSLVPEGEVENFYQKCRDVSAVGRNGTPADVANLISFFASEESGFVTGQSFAVNGGRWLS